MELVDLHRNIITMLGSLGDASTATALLHWLDSSEEERTVAESLSMLNALTKLVNVLNSADQRNILQLQQYSYIPIEVRRELIAMLPQLVYTTHDTAVQHSVRSSLRDTVLARQKYTSSNDILDEAHQALWEVECYLSPDSINTEYWYSGQDEEEI